MSAAPPIIVWRRVVDAIQVWRGPIITQPVLLSVTPNTGSIVGGTAVTLRGYGFSGATASSLLQPGFTIVDDTQITGVTVAGAVGVVSATVSNRSYTSAPLAGAFTYFAGSLPAAPIALDKSLGDASGSTLIKITVASSVGLIAAHLTDGVTSYPLTGFAILDGTHVAGTTSAMPASATPLGVVVSNATGDSPAIAGVFEAFWPTNITNLVQWLRADLGVTLTTGKVTTWADRSGHGFDMTSALVSHPPDAPATWTNGKPAITWNASHYASVGDRLDNTSPPVALTGASAAEAFVVGQDTSTGVSTGAGLWNYGTGSAGWFPFSDGADYENFCSAVRTTGVGGGTYTVPWRYNVQMSGTTMLCLLNGTTIVNQSSLTFQVAGDVSLGNSGIAGFDGQIAEVVIYARALTSGERVRVNAYKADRYGF